MIKTIEFIKLVYVFMFIFNVVALAMLFDWSSFIEVMIPADTVLILGYYLKEASENIAGAYVTAKFRKQ